MLTIINRYSYPCLCHEGIQGNGGTASLILNLDTRLSWVVNGYKTSNQQNTDTQNCQLYALAALDPRKSPWYPLPRRLGGSRASIFILEKWKSLAFVRDWNLDPPASSIVTIPTVAFNQWLTIAVTVVCYSPCFQTCSVHMLIYLSEVTWTVTYLLALSLQQ